MQETLRQDVTLSRIRDREGCVRARVGFEVPSNVTRLTVHVPPGTTVEGSRGFRRRSDVQFVWTEGTGAPALDATVVPGGSTIGGSGRAMADTGEWAILEAPNVLAQWRHRGTQPAFERRILLDDEGVGSSDGGLVYLGPHREHTRRAAGQTIRLVEPRAARLRESPDEILDALAHAARELRAGGRDDEVVGIAAPTRPVNWGPGGIHAGGNAFWARDSSRLDEPNNSWVHEYVHTRQEFGTDATMKWFVEATAVYFATHLTHERGAISDSACHETLNDSSYATDALGSPMAWSSGQVPYRKGSRVACWLDRLLREGGGATLAGVLPAMNGASDGSITDLSLLAGVGDDAIGLPEFKRILAGAIDADVESPAFREIERDLDAAVRGGDVPPETAPPTVEGVPDRLGREPTVDDGSTVDGDPIVDEEPRIGGGSTGGGPVDGGNDPFGSDVEPEAPFGERFGEEIVEGDGRIDEGAAFGDDEGSLIDEVDDPEDEAGTTTVRIETEGSEVTVGGDVDEADVERTGSGISVSTFGSEVEVDTTDGLSVSTSGGASVSVSTDGISVTGGGADVSISSSGGIRVDGDVSIDSATGDPGDGTCSFCGTDSPGDGSRCRSCGWPTGW